MSTTVLRHAHVFAGNGEHLDDASVVIEDDVITQVRSDNDAAISGAEVIDVGRRWVMPGMVSGHFHAEYSDATGSKPGDTYLGGELPYGVLVAIAVRHAGIALRSGVTTVIGAGCHGNIDVELKMAIDRGIVPGPSVVPCGPHVGGTAGEFPRPGWWHGLTNTGVEAGGVTGADAFREAVRRQAGRGVEMIKLIPSGGHGITYGRRLRTMTSEEMRAAIEGAHDLGLQIRAHLSYKEMILEAIDAGIDIVDHADEIDDECIEAMVAHDVTLVPSMLFTQRVIGLGPGSGLGELEDNVRSFENLRKMVPVAHEAGVRILPGDDFGIGFMPHVPGAYAEELQLYVDEVGLAASDVLRWATVNGATTAGRGDTAGTVEEGKVADVVVVDGDPTQTISVLRDPANISMVIKGGAIAHRAI